MPTSQHKEDPLLQRPIYSSHEEYRARDLVPTAPAPIAEQREPRAHIGPTAFDRWWEAFPHKVGKGDARRAFEKALRKAPIDTLLAGVERYRHTKPPDRPWCNPGTWLNQERWTDEPGPEPVERRSKA